MGALHPRAYTSSPEAWGGKQNPQVVHTKNGGQQTSIGTYYVANDRGKPLSASTSYPFYTLGGKGVVSKIRGPCPICRYQVSEDRRETIVVKRYPFYTMMRKGVRVEHPRARPYLYQSRAWRGSKPGTPTSEEAGGGGSPDIAGTALRFVLAV